MFEEADLITITQLKQYTYCPRIVYFEACMPGIRPTTHSMEAGTDAHEAERERAIRRSMYAYQLPEGRREFEVRVRSNKLGLIGIIDEVIFTKEELVVVDYKHASWIGENHILQLTAYALLAEDTFNLPVHRGYVFLMRERRFECVPFSADLRNSTFKTIQMVREMIRYERMPSPNKKPSKCASCEFRRFCNDVW